jgi:transposase-like protein
MSGIDLSDPIFHDEDKAREHLKRVRWPNGVTCPLCGGTDKIKALGGKSQGPGWYHCGDCRRKFTVRVGTVYERSHIPLHKWVMATHLLCASKKGISAHQLHRMLGVTYKSAWFMAHRIREAMIDTESGPLGGEGEIVEADETYTGPSAIDLRPDGTMKRKRGTSSKRVVVSLVERKEGGRVRSIHADKMTKEIVREIVVTNADRRSHLMTDDANMYGTIGREFAKHDTIKHSTKIYARGIVHTNTIEGYFSIFKRGMVGVYQHCGEQHLQRYLTEFDFRYSNRSVSDAERAAVAVKGAEGKRLTYRRASERA